MTSVLTDMSQGALAAAVEANLAEQFAYFRRSPRADVDVSGELVRFRSGIPIPEYNGVIRARFSLELASDALQGRIRAVIAWFAALHQPFFWWLGPTTTPPEILGARYRAGRGRAHPSSVISQALPPQAGGEAMRLPRRGIGMSSRPWALLMTRAAETKKASKALTMPQ
jgi:hypothetical protein